MINTIAAIIFVFVPYPYYDAYGVRVEDKEIECDQVVALEHKDTGALHIVCILNGEAIYAPLRKDISFVYKKTDLR